jgi:hypothetical protein
MACTPCTSRYRACVLSLPSCVPSCLACSCSAGCDFCLLTSLDIPSFPVGCDTGGIKSSTTEHSDRAVNVTKKKGKKTGVRRVKLTSTLRACVSRFQQIGETMLTALRPFASQTATWLLWESTSPKIGSVLPTRRRRNKLSQPASTVFYLSLLSLSFPGSHLDDLYDPNTHMHMHV